MKRLTAASFWMEATEELQASANFAACSAVQTGGRRMKPRSPRRIASLIICITILGETSSRYRKQGGRQKKRSVLRDGEMN